MKLAIATTLVTCFLGITAVQANVLIPTDDTYISRFDATEQATDNGDLTAISVRNDGGSSGSKAKDRLGLFNFTLPTIGQTYVDAAFAVTDDNGFSSSYVFNLYGINDGVADEDFDESITFNTFAHATTATGSSNEGSLIKTDLTLVASGVTKSAGVVTFDTDDLLNFVNADTNGVVSFVLFSTFETGGSPANFKSSEATSGQPTLTVVVPEPSSLAAMSGIGLIMLARRRARRA